MDQKTCREPNVKEGIALVYEMMGDVDSPRRRRQFTRVVVRQKKLSLKEYAVILRNLDLHEEARKIERQIDG